MKYNPKIHHRRSIRLPEYDYAQSGGYFLTICTYKKQCWFGEISHGKIHLNQLGYIVAEEWRRSAEIRTNLKLDTWIIMPNHLHGIVWIVDRSLDKKIMNDRESRHLRVNNLYLDKKLHRQPNSLASFVGGFKASVTKQINQLRYNPTTPIWQRNYYESVIRDERALNSIREYIQQNPQRWSEDPESPKNQDNFKEYSLDLIF